MSKREFHNSLYNWRPSVLCLLHSAVLASFQIVIPLLCTPVSFPLAKPWSHFHTGTFLLPWVPSHRVVVPPPLSRYQTLPNLALKWLILGISEGFVDPVLGLEQYLCWLTGNIASLVANYAECYFGLYPCHQLCPWYQIYGSFCFPI